MPSNKSQLAQIREQLIQQLDAGCSVLSECSDIKQSKITDKNAYGNTSTNLESELYSPVCAQIKDQLGINYTLVGDGLMSTAQERCKDGYRAQWCRKEPIEGAASLVAAGNCVSQHCSAGGTGEELSCWNRCQNAVSTKTTCGPVTASSSQKVNTSIIDRSSGQIYEEYLPTSADLGLWYLYTTEGRGAAVGVVLGVVAVIAFTAGISVVALFPIIGAIAGTTAVLALIPGFGKEYLTTSSGQSYSQSGAKGTEKICSLIQDYNINVNNFAGSLGFGGCGCPEGYVLGRDAGKVVCDLASPTCNSGETAVCIDNKGFCQIERSYCAITSPSKAACNHSGTPFCSWVDSSKQEHFCDATLGVSDVIDYSCPGANSSKISCYVITEGVSVPKCAGATSFGCDGLLPVCQSKEPNPSTIGGCTLSTYSTGNDYFHRDLLSPPTIGSESIVSPATSRAVVYQSISDTTTLWIKNQSYTLADMLNMSSVPDSLGSAPAVGIFRLAPQDYHHFHAPTDATVISVSPTISGQLDSVNPVALNNYSAVDSLYNSVNPLGSNVRQIIQLQSSSGTPYYMVIVGALAVASIELTPAVTKGGSLTKGQDMGYFQFGGSTVVLVFPENTITWDKDLLNYSTGSYSFAGKNTNPPVETYLQVAENIGSYCAFDNCYIPSNANQCCGVYPSTVGDNEEACYTTGSLICSQIVGGATVYANNPTETNANCNQGPISNCADYGYYDPWFTAADIQNGNNHCSTNPFDTNFCGAICPYSAVPQLLGVAQYGASNIYPVTLPNSYGTYECWGAQCYSNGNQTSDFAQGSSYNTAIWCSNGGVSWCANEQGKCWF